MPLDPLARDGLAEAAQLQILERRPSTLPVIRLLFDVLADALERRLVQGVTPAWPLLGDLGEELVVALFADPPPPGIRLDDATLARVVVALGSSASPITLGRARIERQMRELAMEHIAGRIGDAAYLARLTDLRAGLAALDEPQPGRVPAQRGVERLRALGETWSAADVPEARAELLHAIYERIVVVGRTCVAVHLTPSASPTASRWRSPRL